jgi:exodeoxyribonuclease VII small subunit
MSQPAPLPPDIVQLTFEQAMTELESIVRKLEAGQGQLDEAIAAYERGTNLRRHCEAKLGEAAAKIERITQNADGTFSTTPAETG